MRGGKITQVDISIGDEASQQDDRIDEEARAVGHRGEERNQKEPEYKIVHPKNDPIDPGEFRFIFSSVFLKPREPRGRMILEKQSK